MSNVPEIVVVNKVNLVNGNKWYFTIAHHTEKVHDHHHILGENMCLKTPKDPEDGLTLISVIQCIYTEKELWPKNFSM